MTTVSSEKIFEELSRLIQPFNEKKVEVTMKTDIAGDLNIDSVSIMDFVMEVEDRFNIDIPLNELSETRTMQDLVRVVELRIGGSA